MLPPAARTSSLFMKPCPFPGRRHGRRGGAYVDRRRARGHLRSCGADQNLPEQEQALEAAHVDLVQAAPGGARRRRGPSHHAPAGTLSTICSPVAHVTLRRACGSFKGWCAWRCKAQQLLASFALVQLMDFVSDRKVLQSWAEIG